MSSEPACANLRFLFVGAGQMGTALIAGFLQSGMLAAHQITVVDPNPDRLVPLAAEFHVQASHKVADVMVDVIFLCVKPGDVPAALQSLNMSADALVVSIAAGVTIASIDSVLSNRPLAIDARIIRVMPNTPCLVGSAASGISAGSRATPADVHLVMRLMSSVGKAIALPESKMNAVTGLSGSGPAYVFAMIEALADGGVAAGLGRDHAQMLAAQTVLGAAKMVLETGRHPAQLKDAVTSPSGTTIAGLIELERSSFRASLINAVLAATDRADSLSKI